MSENTRKFAGWFFLIFAIPVVVAGLSSMGSEATLEELGGQVLLRGFVGFVGFIISMVTLIPLFGGCTDSERDTIYNAILAAAGCYWLTFILPDNTFVVEKEPLFTMLRSIYAIGLPVFVLIDRLVSWINS